MSALPRSHDRSLAAVSHELAQLEDLASFRTGVLSCLRVLVDCDVASYNEIGRHSGEVFVVADPQDALIAPGAEAFMVYAGQNPLVAHGASTGD